MGLFATIIWLWHSLRRRTTLAIKLPESFKRETKILLWINVCFFSTYLLRGLSDNFIIPLLYDAMNFYACELEGVKDICVPYDLIVYYTWTSVLWDLFPQVLLFWFHHKNFKQVKEEVSVRAVSTNDYSLRTESEEKSASLLIVSRFNSEDMRDPEFMKNTLIGAMDSSSQQLRPSMSASLNEDEEFLVYLGTAGSNPSVTERTISTEVEMLI